MRFVAYDVSIELIRCLRAPIAAIKRHDVDLARQLPRSSSSVSLNLAEGSGRAGGDRRHLYRVALGSALEVKATLDVAMAHGWAPSMSHGRAVGVGWTL
jgi:four helix bundle protein